MAVNLKQVQSQCFCNNSSHKRAPLQAFVHAHEITLKDVTHYEQLSGWGPDEGAAAPTSPQGASPDSLEGLLEEMRRNVTHQARFCFLQGVLSDRQDQSGVPLLQVHAPPCALLVVVLTKDECEAQVMAESIAECALARRQVAAVKAAFPEVLASLNILCWVCLCRHSEWKGHQRLAHRAESAPDGNMPLRLQEHLPDKRPSHQKACQLALPCLQVLAAIRTKQLAQDLLLHKGDQLADLARTGGGLTAENWCRAAQAPSGLSVHAALTQPLPWQLLCPRLSLG